METPAITAASVTNSQSITQPAEIARLPGEVWTRVFELGEFSLGELARCIAPVCKDFYALVDGLRSLAGSRLGVEIPEEAENWRSWLARFRHLSFPNAPTRVFDNPAGAFRRGDNWRQSPIVGTNYIFLLTQIEHPAGYRVRTMGSAFNAWPVGCNLTILKRSDNSHVALPSQLLTQLSSIDRGVVNVRIVGDNVYVVASREWDNSTQAWKARDGEHANGSILRLDIEGGRLETVVESIALKSAPIVGGNQDYDYVPQVPYEINDRDQLTYLSYDGDGRHSVYVKDLLSSEEPQFLGTVELAGEVTHVLRDQDRLVIATLGRVTWWTISDGQLERGHVISLREDTFYVQNWQLIITSDGKRVLAWKESHSNSRRLNDFDTGRNIATHKAKIWRIQGDYLVALIDRYADSTVGARPRLRVWNLATDQQTHHREWPLPDGIVWDMTTDGPLVACNFYSGQHTPSYQTLDGSRLEIINFLTGERLSTIGSWPALEPAIELKGTTVYATELGKDALYRLDGSFDEQVVAQPLSAVVSTDPAPESNDPPGDTPEALISQHPWCTKLMVAALVIGALALTYSVVRVGRQKVFVAT